MLDATKHGSGTLSWAHYRINGRFLYWVSLAFVTRKGAKYDLRGKKQQKVGAHDEKKRTHFLNYLPITYILGAVTRQIIRHSLYCLRASDSANASNSCPRV